MKKIFNLTIILLFAFTSYSQQYFTFGQSTTYQGNVWYLQNSPTNMDGNRAIIGYIRANWSPTLGVINSRFEMFADSIRFSKLSGSGPAVAGIHPNGTLYRLNKWSLIDTNYLGSKWWVAQNFAELSDLSNYQPVGSYIEMADTNDFVVTKTAMQDEIDLMNLSLASKVPLSAYSWSDLPGKPPSYSPAAHTHVISDISGLQIALDSKLSVENDPIFTAHPSAVITLTMIGNWQTAFSWGNHATQGYITAAFTGFDSRYKPFSYTPTKPEIVLALGGDPLLVETDGSITNEIELPTQSGNSGKALFTNGTSPYWNPVLTTEVDGSTTNEIQNLSIVGNTLSVSGGNSVALPMSPTYTAGSGITISSGSISATDPSITNEIQSLAISGNTLSISGSNSISLPTSGTVTSVGVTSTSLSIANTPVTTSGSISVNLPTTVTAGSYGIVTVDQYGRVISGKRQQPYSGVTAGSGTYSVTFGVPYSVAPNIQANIIGGNPKQFTSVTVTTTGFTVTAYQLNNISLTPLIAVDVLLSSTSVLNNANIDVLITEK